MAHHHATPIQLTVIAVTVATASAQAQNSGREQHRTTVVPSSNLGTGASDFVVRDTVTSIGGSLAVLRNGGSEKWRL